MENTLVDLTPLIQFALGVVALVLSGFAVWAANWTVVYLKAKTKIELGQDARDLINSAVQRGIKFAQAQLNEQVSKLDPKVNVGHPAVAIAGNYVVKAVPKALADAGVTEEQLAEKILAEMPAIPVDTQK